VPPDGYPNEGLHGGSCPVDCRDLIASLTDYRIGEAGGSVRYRSCFTVRWYLIQCPRIFSILCTRSWSEKYRCTRMTPHHSLVFLAVNVIFYVMILGNGVMNSCRGSYGYKIHLRRKKIIQFSLLSNGMLSKWTGWDCWEIPG